jgi:hypothetical protein
MPVLNGPEQRLGASRTGADQASVAWIDVQRFTADGRRCRAAGIRLQRQRRRRRVGTGLTRTAHDGGKTGGRRVLG